MTIGFRASLRETHRIMENFELDKILFDLKLDIAGWGYTRGLSHGWLLEIVYSWRDRSGHLPGVSSAPFFVSFTICAILVVPLPWINRWILEFLLVSLERRIPIWVVTDSLFSSSSSMCRWSTWRGFLKAMLRRGLLSSCVICAEREVWMNSASFRILRNLLPKETYACHWCMCIGFLDRVRSLFADRLPIFISLARLSVSLTGLIHLHYSTLSSVLSDGILISSPDSLEDHLGYFRSTFRIRRWRREFLCFTHLSRVL